MNITILDLYFPPARSHIKDVNEIYELHFLLNDQKLVEKILKVRRIMKYPIEGYTFNNLVQEKIFSPFFENSLPLEISEGIIKASHDKYGLKSDEEINQNIVEYLKSTSVDITKYKKYKEKDYKTDFKNFIDEQMKIINFFKSINRRYENPINDHNFFLLTKYNCYHLSKLNPEDDITFTTNKRMFLKMIKDNKNNLMINIPTKITRNQLNKFLDVYWEEMKKLMDELPTQINKYSSNLQIGREIYNLKSNGISYSTISEQLYLKYPYDERLNDSLWVKETYKRYSNNLKDFYKKQ